MSKQKAGSQKQDPRKPDDRDHKAETRDQKAGSDAGKGNLIARASVTIDAPPDEVWKALVDPAAIRQYMFGTNVETDWREGSPIVWRGEWQGKAYQDKGVVTRIQPGKKLQYSHFSPQMGKPDLPENYHNITIDLNKKGGATEVTLTQDNNADEKARDHSSKNWKMMLASLKQYVEQ